MYQIKFTVREIDSDYPDTEETKNVIATFETFSNQKAKDALQSPLETADKLMRYAIEYQCGDSDSIREFQAGMFDNFDIDLTMFIAGKCITLRENNGSNLYTFIEIAELIQEEITFTILDDDCDIVYNLEV